MLRSYKYKKTTQIIIRMSSTSKVPTNLRSIICDFTSDLSVVFPEYTFMWSKWASASDAEYEKLYAHCLAIYPERFFDIMYTNADIFNADSKIDVCFLPDVNFRLLFNCEGVSEKTKTSIWKYLQLLLFTIVGSVNDTKRFGDAANIFEAMDENELHEKMAETLESVGEFFKNMEEDDSDEHEHERSGERSGTSGTQNDEHEHERSGTSGTPTSGTTTDEDGINEIKDVMENIFEGLKQGTTNNSGANKKPGMKMPDPEILKEHLKTLLDGKLGKLAKEFTDEFTNDLKGFFDEEDEANMKSSKDVLMKLIKDPKKMVLILKKITTKLQERMKRGDISQEELMAEMSGLMEKMKEMGGGADFAEMMKGLAGTPIMKMFEKGLGGGGKLDMNKMTQMSKQAEMKERLRRKMEQKKAQTQSQSLTQSPSLTQSNTTQVVPVGEKNYVVKIGNEVQAKSGLRPPVPVSNGGVPVGNGALTEDELISLFSKKNKGAKKTK